MEHINVFKEENEIWDIAKRILMSVFLAIVITFAFSLLAGFKFFIVQTGSMTPRLPIHSMVMTDHTEYEDLKIGDIITYRSTNFESGITYTHRVVQFDTDGVVITKGDASPTLERIVKERYVGKVIFDSWPIGALITLIKENIFITVAIMMVLFLWYAFS